MQGHGKAQRRVVSETAAEQISVNTATKGGPSSLCHIAVECGDRVVAQNRTERSQVRGARMLQKTVLLLSVVAVVGASRTIAPANAADISSFTEGDVVVAVEGNGSGTGSYTDNQAAPLTLYEYDPSGASMVGSFELPQTRSGTNFAVSGEYGSSSEATLQLSGNGRYLTIMGYGVNAAAFDAAYLPGFTTDLFGA